MSKIIQIPAILDGFSLRKDGGAGVRFVTNELSDADVSEIKHFYGKFGFLLFKESEFAQEEVPKEDPEIEGQSPSKRLRSVLFVYWKQHMGTGDYETFYRQQVEKFIHHVKDKLEPAV